MNASTIAEVIAAIGLALTTDSAFLSWCTAQFAKTPTVYIGIDENNPPAESVYPIAALVDIREVSDVPGNRRTFDIDIGFGVINSTITTSSKLVTYAGFAQAESFREQGELAVIRALASPNVKFTGNAERIQMYPTFVSYTTLTVEENVSRRGPRFT